MGRPVVFFDIGCRDKEKTRRFYETLFEWRSEAYGPYSLRVATDERGIPGNITSLGHEPHHYVMIYVEVDDIPGHLAQVESLGGRVVVPQTAVPGGAHFAWVADPDGNLVGLWHPGAGA